MAHVFRFHNDNATLDGWDTSSKYDNKAIKAIQDPSGGSASLPITSIPTPFAGFELTKSAFEHLASTKQLKGNTIHHKLVSYALDVAEIFFNYQQHQNDYEIIEWNIQTDLPNLLNSEDSSTKRLGETLQLYIMQDSATFNFEQMSSIYMLNYINGPAPLNIVGGTSPTSLCIASTNDLSYVNTYLSNNHKAFDSNPTSFQPLYDRDPEFIKYLWTLTKVQSTIPGEKSFAILYEEVNKYIQECFINIEDLQLKTELRNLTADDYSSNYQPLTYQTSSTVFFMKGIPLCMKVGASKNISTKSDFRILSTKYRGDQLPLVLPNMAYNEPMMKYTSGYWDYHNNAPFYDSESDINKRVLPFDKTNYPYLTADDVFQPFLIRTIYPINSETFFTASINEKEFSYLLPLKKEIFDFFDIDFIKGFTHEFHHRKIFELQLLPLGNVKAIFNIPIQQNKYITFERIYYNSETEPDIKVNKGSIVENCFDIFLYPFFHTNGLSTPNQQRIYLIDEDTKTLTMRNEYDIKVYKQNSPKPLPLDSINRADKRKQAAYTTKYFRTDSEFDYLEVHTGFATGLIIPIYPEIQKGVKQFEFAIDFGTTNTHIEYKVDGQIHPFEISDSDLQTMSLHDYKDTILENIFYRKDKDSFIKSIKQEFVPLYIGGSKDIKFPLRTNICKPKVSYKGNRKSVTLGDYSIGFHYEKYETYKHNDYLTNLKWRGDENSELIESFFEELLFMIRNKIILNGGDLSKTKITWFYPVSMATYQIFQLEEIWEKLSKHIIDKECTLNKITESLAPFYYYKNQEGVNSAHRPVVSMDIGGGTTDFVVYQKNLPVAVSSIRFAGNNIYGDFIGMNMNLNGFVKRYEEEIKNAISTHNNVINCYNDIKKKGSSADLISFMFSLEYNPELLKNKIIISLSEKLKKDYELKILLLLFYAAEIYYMANLLRAKDIPTPAYITVSGTASKVFHLIGDRRSLEKIAKHIFNKVLNDNNNVELKWINIPKEITCKGGLDLTDDDMNVDLNKIKYNLTGSSTLDYQSSKKYSSINQSIENEVVKSYYDFIKFFFKLDSEFSFADNFGIKQNRFDEYLKILTEKAEEDLATVLEERKKALKGEKDPEITDSLFFFPLSGAINRLAYYISQN